MESETRISNTNIDVGYFCNNNYFYCYEEKDNYGVVKKI